MSSHDYDQEASTSHGFQSPPKAQIAVIDPRITQWLFLAPDGRMTLHSRAWRSTVACAAQATSTLLRFFMLLPRRTQRREWVFFIQESSWSVNRSGMRARCSCRPGCVLVVSILAGDKNCFETIALQFSQVAASSFVLVQNLESGTMANTDQTLANILANKTKLDAQNSLCEQTFEIFSKKKKNKHAMTTVLKIFGNASVSCRK